MSERRKFSLMPSKGHFTFNILRVSFVCNYGLAYKYFLYFWSSLELPQKRSNRSRALSTTSAVAGFTMVRATTLGGELMSGKSGSSRQRRVDPGTGRSYWGFSWVGLESGEGFCFKGASHDFAGLGFAAVRGEGRKVWFASHWIKLASQFTFLLPELWRSWLRVFLRQEPCWWFQRGRDLDFAVWSNDVSNIAFANVLSDRECLASVQRHGPEDWIGRTHDHNLFWRFDARRLWRRLDNLFNHLWLKDDWCSIDRVVH